jgi:hypothetical protein
MQEAKFTTELVAPCGMNCGKCIAYFGYTMKGRKRKHPCKGCRSRDNVYYFKRSKCVFLKKKCDLLATKKIVYSFEWTDFPCDNLEALDKKYRNKY